MATYGYNWLDICLIFGIDLELIGMFLKIIFLPIRRKLKILNSWHLYKKKKKSN